VTAKASLRREGNWNRTKQEERDDGEEENERKWKREDEEAKDVTKVTAI
jgi:hypothetical protein